MERGTALSAPIARSTRIYDASLRTPNVIIRCCSKTFIFSDGSQCADGIFGCIFNGLEEYARLLDELSYQLNVSDTLHLSSEDETGLDNEFIELTPDDLNLKLCSSCLPSWPTPIEDYFVRSQNLILNSTLKLKRLRSLCYGLKRKLRQSHETSSEKSLVISQLEDSVNRLGMTHFISYFFEGHSFLSLSLR